ncbi:hypothetical protein T552_02543 [Pneumocystis carinii B80]|uniref:Antiviral helicase SKI2 n=1 Tax=Pneumocystis carinii (strain B80) TaxID=1408658 RepID=A0A0W4ZFA8_PNEC8|nr:hypothetical protein T552_02543 [Pneumocystis carinii B80]KTW27051.1 hypothetical protein T552_02543 [Pneumocystis carinii B80]
MQHSDLSEAFEAIKTSLDKKKDDVFHFDGISRQNFELVLSRNDIFAQLEQFMVPPLEFSIEWLNKLHGYVGKEVEYKELFQVVPFISQMSVEFIREGLEGRIVGYKEEAVSMEINSKNSTAFERNPAPRGDFVRGRSTFLPFVSEKLKVLKLDQDKNDEKHMGLFLVAPGLSRTGILKEYEYPDKFRLELDENVDPSHWRFDSIESFPLDNKEKLSDGISDYSKIDHSLDSVDDFLSSEFSLPFSNIDVSKYSTKQKTKEWAHVVNIKAGFSDFHELVPNMAYNFPFELDTFQKFAIYHLEKTESVFVSAHTSAGKTVVAEYAIALALKHMTKAIYTSPIKALSNQKFRDFYDTFEDVGILTGDIQIRPEASCLIMTTEILRSMLYKGSDLIRDVEFVIFDEVHYVNDFERGVVWEEVIIMLPEYVTLILLSATVPNTKEFAEWIGRTRQKDIYVISTARRPIPLEHFLWVNRKMFKIVDEKEKFLMQGYKDATMVLKKDKNTVSTQLNKGGNNDSNSLRNQRRGNLNRTSNSQNNSKKGEKSTNIRGSDRSVFKNNERQDRSIWVYLVNHLRKINLLPVVVFVFSKKKCEDNANSLANLDLLNHTAKSEVHVIIEKLIARLCAEDSKLPQIIRMRDLLSRGIGVHHGGLLPIVKEIVEILFTRSLVKILFATETFAMGINMPAKSVVFSGIRKHDGQEFRYLLSGEYTQMAGRAGRRGLDTIGTVIVMCNDDIPDINILTRILLGNSTKLKSQFRLTYNMILNILRVKTLKVEEMIKRSFSENTSQALLPEHRKEIMLYEKNLSSLKHEPCSFCDIDLTYFYNKNTEYNELTKICYRLALSSPYGKKIFSPGRVVIYKENNLYWSLAILLGEASLSFNGEKCFHALYVKQKDSKNQANKLPFIPVFWNYDFGLDSLKAEQFKEKILPISSIELITQIVVKLDVSAVRSRIKESFCNICEQIKKANFVKDFEFLESSFVNVRDLKFKELFMKRKLCKSDMYNKKCLECPDFVLHFLKVHEKNMLVEKIEILEHLISDQNLELLPDYEQRISVLKELDYIDDNLNVLLKGRVACEINSAHELVLTELILENTLAEFESDEIVALLSVFVFEEKTESLPSISPHLEKGKDMIINVAKKINLVQDKYQVLSLCNELDFENKSCFGLVEVVYEWARGMSFERIMDLTDVLEGSIVRVMTRLDQVLRECASAARIIGDISMYSKMEDCQEKIRRNIIFCPSLYV